jgi:hypothetical protein
MKDQTLTILGQPPDMAVMITGISRKQMFDEARETACRIGKEFLDLQCPYLTLMDLHGVTNHIDKASREPTLVCFESIDQARTDVLNEVIDIIVSRHLGGIPLHPGSRVVCTAMSTRFIDSLLLNRYFLLN